MYPTRAGPVLDSVDLEFAPGETVVLVGPSGGGKSTVASLLLRFVEPTRGLIRVGDIDLAECDGRSWRAQIAWVPQRPTLLRGTVADNIRLSDPAAADERVRAAAQLAGADDFVLQLPGGYGTAIGEGGRPLSAGQLQRIALARAFLRDAGLVVLDEPTANLDAESAEVVMDAIDRLGERRTMLLIAHRPEFARRGHRVVRLEAGRIVEPATVEAF